MIDFGLLDHCLHHVQICAQLDNLRSSGGQCQSFQRSSDQLKFVSEQLVTSSSSFKRNSGQASIV
jgi:hypothetical protein